MSGVRAVLFDLDGVLVDSYEAWFLAVNDVAAGFGLGAVSRDRFAAIWGQGIDADVRNLYPGRSPDEVRAGYEAAIPRHAAAIRRNPDGAPTLGRLRAAGVGTACVTNTPVGIARGVLSGAGLASSFDAVSGARPGLREKPAPDLLLEALDALSVAPAHALMVGDSRFDEEGAAAAKVRFLRYDLRDGASLRDALERAVPALRGAPA